MRNPLLVVQPVVLAISPLRRNPQPAEVHAVLVTARRRKETLATSKKPPRRNLLPAVLPVVLAKNSKLQIVKL